MKEILLLTIPHAWLTLENAQQKIELLEEVVLNKTNKEIIIISGIIDHGFALAQKVKQKKSGVLEEIGIFTDEQAKRYVELSKIINLKQVNPRIASVVRELKNSIKQPRKRWEISGSMSVFYSEISTILFQEILLFRIGHKLVSWPKDVVCNASLKYVYMNNINTADRIFNFIRFGNLPKISAVVPSYGVNLSGIQMLLGKESIDKFEETLLSTISFYNKKEMLFMNGYEVQKINMDFYHSSAKKLTEQKTESLNSKELAVA